MLINLSNHAFDTWDSGQQQTAHENFGEVVDLTFPEVNPHAKTGEVAALAKNYLNQCITILAGIDGKKNAVHITGEHCFVFLFVTLAKAENIMCVCSTTPRIVTSHKSTKTSVFYFEKLRSYF